MQNARVYFKAYKIELASNICFQSHDYDLKMQTEAKDSSRCVTVKN